VSGLWWLNLPTAGARGEAGMLSVSVEAVGQPSRRALLHTAHLAHEAAAGVLRQAQVVEMDRRIAMWRADAEAPGVHVLVGDFNAIPDADEMRYLRGLCALAGGTTHWQDAWLRHHASHEPGATWSTEQGEARQRRSCDVDRRIDYVYVSTRLRTGLGSVLQCELAMEARDAQSQLCGSDHRAVVADLMW